MDMATILYARVSTLEQTIEHQFAHATAAGFAIDDPAMGLVVGTRSRRQSFQPVK
jgi:DNA invertase Pin-like site-specific DNA recombinase